MILEKSPLTSWRSEEAVPQVDPTAHIHSSAVLIGDVRVGKNVIICPGAVIRADEGSPIIIGDGTNVQDGVIMHGLKGSTIDIGKNCSIAHGAVIHGPCIIGSESFIGFNAVVYKSQLGIKCFISHCSLVYDVNLPEFTLVPAGLMLQSQSQVKDLSRVSSKETDFNNEVLAVNQELCKGYKAKSQS